MEIEPGDYKITDFAVSAGISKNTPKLETVKELLGEKRNLKPFEVHYYKNANYGGEIQNLFILKYREGNNRYSIRIPDTHNARLYLFGLHKEKGPLIIRVLPTL